METLAAPDISGAGTPESIWTASRWWTRVASVDAHALVPPASRAVVVAPHPDDEVLGIGALLAQLALSGRKIVIVAVSDGDASHPGSSQWPPAVLARQRAQETGIALDRLGIVRPTIIRLQLQDGALHAAEERIAQMLGLHLQRSDVLFSTWRRDGHPDHDAVGRAAAFAADVAQCAHIEYPVWMWHWAKPDDANVPWQRARRIDVSAQLGASKRWAIAAFVSQLEADPSTGRAPILPREVQRYFSRKVELIFQ